jgi:hypothetical protein
MVSRHVLHYVQCNIMIDGSENASLMSYVISQDSQS